MDKKYSLAVEICNKYGMDAKWYQDAKGKYDKTVAACFDIQDELTNPPKLFAAMQAFMEKNPDIAKRPDRKKLFEQNLVQQGQWCDAAGFNAAYFVTHPSAAKAAKDITPK